MIPRADIIAVQQEIAIASWCGVRGRRAFTARGYNDTLDDPTGMIHIRDLIAFVAARASHDPAAAQPQVSALNLANVDLTLPLSAAKIVREILYAPPSMRRRPARQMQATRIHLALVIDEYGGTDGLVSMEDWSS